MGKRCLYRRAGVDRGLLAVGRVDTVLRSHHRVYPKLGAAVAPLLPEAP